jgi:ceramide glucosyltransferase
MLSPRTAASFVLFGLIVIAILYYLLSLWASVRFFSEKDDEPNSPLRPVTIMVPLCGAELEAYERYSDLCRLDYPSYQIVFGVRDSEDSSLPIVKRLINDFPTREIALVVGAQLIGQNLKISNLHNMLDRVKHEQIVIIDSDVRVKADFLRQIIPALNEKNVGLVTCLYRASAAPTFPSLMEAIGISSDFQPGVLVARAIEGMRFALGAVMATTRKTLDSIGGFIALADYLADDYMLGHLVWKAGYEVRLSKAVVETTPGHFTFRSVMKHQIRLARGVRACRPWSYSGLVVTHGTALACLNAAISQGSWSSLNLLMLVLAIRTATTWQIGIRRLNDEILRNYLWLLPFRDLLGFVTWCSAFLGRSIEWRDTHFRIGRGGKIIQIK